MSKTAQARRPKGFADAAQSLKLYRRAELLDKKDRPLIEQLYVDPLPENSVLSAMIRPNTTLLIGRKGTGKSTVFQRAQHEIRRQKRSLSAYIDIKTVYEAATVDNTILSRLGDQANALSADEVRRLLLYKAFIRTVLGEVRDEIKKQVASSFIDLVVKHLGPARDQVFDALDELMESSLGFDVTDITGFDGVSGKQGTIIKASSASKEGGDAKLKLSEKSASLEASGQASREASKSSEETSETNFSRILLRTLDITRIIEELQSILALVEVRHLYIFIDDFSELPEEAMQVFVDTVLAPLNNWSNELIKFKIAAYPGRIYYGKLDPLKIDEIYLDLFKLYGSNDVSSMEEKAIDFTRRLLDNRIQHYCKEDFSAFCGTAPNLVVRNLFFASLGNPRTLGHILFNLQESHVAYERPIVTRGVRDASVKYYDEKIEPYFGIQKFRQETFLERSTIFGLKELLEEIIERARDLRTYRQSSVTRDIDGQPPTSHFYVVSELDSLLSTLELNFFLTKYFEMKDRDGKSVSVYALNFGLCNRYSIEFGRPTGRREYRLYFVERIFDYTNILRKYLQRNQEIRCNHCGKIHDIGKLESLALFDMLCPSCRAGTCEVVNLSRKYKEVLEKIRPELLLPETELGILETLHTEGRELFAREIAGELDCSYQLVGRRARIMEERGLIDRIKRDRMARVYKIREEAVQEYFEDNNERHLSLGREDGI